MTAATKKFARAETAGAARAGGPDVVLDIVSDMGGKNARAGVKYSLGNGLDWRLIRRRGCNHHKGLS